MAKKDTRDKLFVDVVETAVEFHKRRLWTRVDSAYPISIRVEGEEHPLLCFVLGSAGTNLGISALRGEHAMEAFEEVVIAGGQLGMDRNHGLLLLCFEMPSEVEPEFLRPIQQSGRVFGRSSTAPIFLAKGEGEPSRPMSRPELRIMLAVMRTLLAAATTGQLLQREWDWKRRTLELTLEGKGKKARVLDSVVTWPPPRAEEEREVATPVLTQRWYDVTKAAERTGATWGVALLPAPPIRNDPSPREMLIVGDEATGMMLTPKLIASGDPDELAAAFLDLVESGSIQGDDAPGLPAELRFLQLAPMRQLRSALDEISIAATHDPDQPRLLDTIEGMDEHLEECLRDRGALAQPGEDDRCMGLWKADDTRLSTYLIKAGTAKGEAMKHRPLEQFFGNSLAGREAVLNERDSTAGIVYFSWFLFHYRSSKGAPTMAERVRDRQVLPARQQALLEARIDARLIVGRITGVAPGAWVELENVVNGDVHRVHDIELSESAREGLGLVLQPFPVEEWTFAMLAGPPIPALRIEETLGKIEALGLEFEDGAIAGDLHRLGELFLARPMAPPEDRASPTPDPGAAAGDAEGAWGGIEREGADLWPGRVDS